MVQARWWLPAMVAGSLMTGSLMVGCGDSNGGGGTPQVDGGTDDVQTPMDGTVDDVPGSDVQMMGDTPKTQRDSTADGPADGARDATGDRGGDASTDRPTTDRPVTSTDPCAAASVTDLTTRTPDAMGIVRISTNNNMAGQANYLPPSMGCVAGMEMNTSGFQVAFRYRMRATALLEASTVSDATLESLDTVVQIASACTRTGMNLACNDDDAEAEVPQSTARTATPIPMGTEVFIFVGGYDPPFNDGDQQGDFELSIREFSPGTSNNPCRTMAPFCDTGLACTVAAPTAMANGTCRTPVAAGAPCTAADVCVMGAGCIANPGSTTMGTCRNDGSSGGRCRVTGTTCDAGLSCTAATPTATAPGLCRTTAALGADCDPTRVMNACASGSTCQLAPTATSLTHTACAATGARGGLCRAAAPRCDTGFECSTATTNPTCLAPAAAGAACDVTGTSTYCPVGSTCAPNATLTGGTCQVNGVAAGTPCREAAPRCDTGLECSAATGAGFCRRSVPAGMTCDVRFNSTFCAMGGVCAAATGAASGSCIGVTPETEPNNTPATGNGPATMPTTIFSAALTPATDMDCFRVTVPMNGSVTAFTGDASGGCALGTGADTLMTLYGPTGTMVANNDDAAGRGLCSEINPMTMGDTALPAGTYSLCVANYAGGMAGPVPIASYFLTVRINPAP